MSDDSRKDDEDAELPEDGEGSESLDEVDVRDYLRAALKPPPDRPDQIIRGVHKKIREDSELKGMYFSDGWSTSRAPKETYLITSILMLVVVILAWFLLGPYGL